MQVKVLLLGPKGSKLSLAGQIIRERGGDIYNAHDIVSGLEFLGEGRRGISAVIVDIELSVKELSQGFRDAGIEIPIISCGEGEVSPKKAARSVKDGACEYFPLPPDGDLLVAMLEGFIGDHREGQAEVIYSSVKMAEVMEKARKIAFSDFTILLSGESGTGKEVLASYIHRQSGREGNRLVAINCAAIPDNLLESELFGHEKGSFSGATESRKGKFEEAAGSTLLLDEISEMDLRLQAKLLRVLQEKEIERVGSNKPLRVDVRIIATTNRKLREEVEKGKFREDLYFRLNVMSVELPTLRSRVEDIETLVHYFLRKYRDTYGGEERSIGRGVIEKLERHNWPGNVRELENSIYRGLLLSSSGELTSADIELEGESISSEEREGESNTERSYIVSTLEHCRGDALLASKILGISIRALKSKLEKYELR